MKQTVDWHKHWTRPSPGFHEGRVNTYLQRYFPSFGLQPGDLVFMPLCGKAHDIHWLSQQGMQVVGVELSGVALESFFAEFSLPYHTRQERHFRIFQADNITLYQGDIMQLQPHQLADCKLVYDRAAIVAIEALNRQSYVRQLTGLVPESTPMLVVTLEYDQSAMSGPPFSVPVAEIAGHFASRYLVEQLETVQQIDERPRWRELGLDSLMETALRLVPNP